MPIRASKLRTYPAFPDGLAVRMKHPAMFLLQLVTVLIRLKFVCISLAWYVIQLCQFSRIEHF